MKAPAEKLLANIDGAPLDYDLGLNNMIGQPYVANASRFIEANFSEPLTTFAVGWKDSDNLDELLEFVCPVVPTSRRFEFAKATNSESFLTETDDVRGIGADFKRVEYTSDKENGTTLNKGLTIRVDLDNVEGMPNWREVYTSRLMRRLTRNELRRGITILAAACTDASGTHDWAKATPTVKDPDIDVLLNLIDAGGDIAGVNPNRVLYGFTAWAYRAQGYGGQQTAAGFAGAARTPQGVAQYLGVDSIMISRQRYQSTASAKAKIVTAASVFAFYAEQGMTTEDPSTIKRFVSNTAGGTKFRVYEQQVNAKLVDITVEHYSNIIATSTLGARRFTVTNS